jgi:hypothetical protein
MMHETKDQEEEHGTETTPEIEEEHQTHYVL